MIGWLSGRIVDRPSIGKLVVDAQGVGYDVETSLSTFFQLETPPDMIRLHIHTIVREDAFLLYGFLEKQERELFRALIKVSGIGPKAAMSLLSSLSTQELVACIQNRHVEQLIRVPGVGRKTAERLVVELSDRLEAVLTTPSSTPQATLPHAQLEAIAALEALGYKPLEASKKIKAVDTGSLSCEQLIRAALKM